MTEHATFRLPDQKLGHSLVVKGWEWAKEQIGIGKVVHVEFKLETRTDRQNRLLHALIGDVARQALFYEEKRSVDFWKHILISAHSAATNDPIETFKGLEGELVSYRESSARMSKKRLASLIDYIQCYCAENEIELRESRQWMD